MNLHNTYLVVWLGALSPSWKVKQKNHNSRRHADRGTYENVMREGVRKRCHRIKCMFHECEGDNGWLLIYSMAGLHVRSDIDRIRIRNRNQPLRTNLIRIHDIFKTRYLCLENFPSILWWVLIRNCFLFQFLTVLSHNFFCSRIWAETGSGSGSREIWKPDQEIFENRIRPDLDPDPDPRPYSMV